MNLPHCYAVILAGGKGERLWPLSRNHQPKQLLPFIQGKSLIELTIERIRSLLNKDQILIITTQEQQTAIQKLVGSKVKAVLAEPASRNTGPAILFACNQIIQQDPQSIILFLPADHFIPNTSLFCKSLETLFDYCRTHQNIALLGIKPHFPATGYGYIKAEENEQLIKKVSVFVEKPSKEKAESYIKMPTMFWNAGIFCATAKTFIQEYQTCAPALLRNFELFSTGKKSYTDLENISIDYAVLEKSNHTVVLPADFEWSDVGNLATFLQLKEPVQSKKDHRVIAVDAQNNLIETCKKLTVLIGIDNICIVETDDVLLVAKKEDVEKVKVALSQLKNNKLLSYL